jgi:hypothetical protein
MCSLSLHSRRERQWTVTDSCSKLPCGHAVDSQDQDSASSEEEVIPTRTSRKKHRRPYTQAVAVFLQLPELASSLSTINSDSFREGFQRHPAVFVHPPQPHTSLSIEVPSFELDPYAPSNHAFLQYEFLQYERSLQEASDFSAVAPVSRENCLRLIRLTRLQTTQVSDGQERASRLKEDLWQHQQNIGIARLSTPVCYSSLLRSN